MGTETCLNVPNPAHFRSTSGTLRVRFVRPLGWQRSTHSRSYAKVGPGPAGGLLVACVQCAIAMQLNERAVPGQRAGEVCGGAGGSLQLFMLMHALRTCFGSSRVRSTSSRHFKNKVSVTDRCYRCTERVSVHFVRPAAQSISSCTGSVPEVDLDKIELLRLGTFLYAKLVFGTVRHVSVTRPVSLHYMVSMYAFCPPVADATCRRCHLACRR